MSSFQASSTTFGTLLGPGVKKLVVPEFQRGYSWEKKNIKAFWDDIVLFQKTSNQRDSRQEHFLGAIVTMESNDTIDVLDGQQRIATATILLSVLRDAANSIGTRDAEQFALFVQRDFIEDEDIGMKIELGELDRQFFRDNIQSDPSVERRAGIRSHRLIQDARKQLSDLVASHLGPLDPAEKVEAIKQLRNTVRSGLVMARIPVQSELDAYYIFETLNDRGLRLSVPDLLLNYLMRIAKKSDRPVIREQWSDMVTQIAHADVNYFLRHMWVSKYGDLKRTDLFRALKSHIEKNKIDAIAFAQDCALECDRYVELINADEKQLGESAPYVSRLLRDLRANAAVPLLLSCYGKLEKTDFLNVVKWSLVFVTRYSVLAGLDSSGLENVLFGLAREVREMEKDRCAAAVKAKLVQSSPTDEQIEGAIVKRSLAQNAAKYVVRRLAAYAQSNTKEIDLHESNLEHVFPKRPSEEWENAEDLEPLLWHLGNLTVFGVRLNSAVANRGYGYKKTKFGESEVQMTRDIAKTYKSWTPEVIQERTKRMAKDAIKVWDFDNPSRV